MTAYQRSHTFRAAIRGLLSAATLFAAPVAIAGPPLLCHPFETGGAPSLPWGDGWNKPRADYDTRARVAADTLALLAPKTPIVARMEILRRASMYASRDGAALRDLAARLETRVASAAGPEARALALFDAGYFAETLQDIERLQGYDMPRFGRIDAAAVRAVLAQREGSTRIAQALSLRPDDASLRFAAALVASADRRPGDEALHRSAARAGAGRDALLARNLARLD